METVSTKLEESRVRLVQQGTQFIQQTNGAVSAFVGKGRKARERFATDTRKASEQLVVDAGKASKALAQGLSAEAKMWLDALELDRRVAALPKLPASIDAGRVPSPVELERELLAKLEGALRDLAGKVASRVSQLDALGAAQLPASTAPVAATRPSAPAPAKASNGTKKTSNGTVAAVTVPSAPITGYDDMSAKDIVTRLERLTDDKAAAVLTYEAANKKRATVLRAAEQRLAAEA